MRIIIFTGSAESNHCPERLLLSCSTTPRSSRLLISKGKVAANRKLLLFLILCQFMSHPRTRFLYFTNLMFRNRWIELLDDARIRLNKFLQGVVIHSTKSSRALLIGLCIRNGIFTIDDKSYAPLLPPPPIPQPHYCRRVSHYDQVWTHEAESSATHSFLTPTDYFHTASNNCNSTYYGVGDVMSRPSTTTGSVIGLMC